MDSEDLEDAFRGGRRNDWDVCVLRHVGTLEWLAEEVEAFNKLPVITGNATPADVAGKRVLGVLPLHLAALAASVTEVVIDPPPRGAELTMQEVAARGPFFRTFQVREVRP